MRVKKIINTVKFLNFVSMVTSDIILKQHNGIDGKTLVEAEKPIFVKSILINTLFSTYFKFKFKIVPLNSIFFFVK